MRTFHTPNSRANRIIPLIPGSNTLYICNNILFPLHSSGLFSLSILLLRFHHYHWDFSYTGTDGPGFAAGKERSVLRIKVLITAIERTP